MKVFEHSEKKKLKVLSTKLNDCLKEKYKMLSFALMQSQNFTLIVFTFTITLW